MRKELERTHEILDVLHDNPYLSGDTIDQIVLRLKRSCTPRGPNSENIAEFLIRRIPEVNETVGFHAKIEGLDWDLLVGFVHINPVYVQVKSSENGVDIFSYKVERKISEGNRPCRWVVLDMSKCFDNVLSDFINQVNTSEYY